MPTGSDWAVGMALVTTLLVLNVSGPTWYVQPHATLAISPKTLGAPGDVPSGSSTCPFSARAWHCSLTLSESASSNVRASWSSAGQGQTTFSPSQGTLSPGGSVNVSVTIASCGGQYLLNFTGPQNVAQATFTCG